MKNPPPFLRLPFLKKSPSKNPPPNFKTSVKKCKKNPPRILDLPFPQKKGDYPPRIFMDFYAKMSANVNRGILVGYPL